MQGDTGWQYVAQCIVAALFMPVDPKLAWYYSTQFPIGDESRGLLSRRTSS